MDIRDSLTLLCVMSAVFRLEQKENIPALFLSDAISILSYLRSSEETVRGSRRCCERQKVPASQPII